MTKCLVTGGCGFIGSHLVDKLIDRGHEVVILDNLSTGRLENLNSKAAFYNEDITNLDAIVEYFVDVDYVFHLAALPRIQPSFTLPVEHENANVIGTINCLLAAKGQRIKKFVFGASSSCYGNPDEVPTSESSRIRCMNPYALQKYTAEQYCLMLGDRYDVSVNSVRYFNPYGPRSFNLKNPLNAYSSVIGIFNNQSRTEGVLTITGNGEQSRDFIHVYDVVEATILAAQTDKCGEVYNIGYGESFTINEVADLFGCEKTYVDARPGEAQITLANVDKAMSHLAWRPQISLKEGIKIL